MADRKDICTEVDEVENLIKSVLNATNFHYSAVEMALSSLQDEYKEASKFYANFGTMSDIAVFYEKVAQARSYRK